MSENDWKSNVHLSTLATALFCINVIFIFLYLCLYVFFYLYLNLYLYLRSESHLCQWCQLRQLEYHNSPRGLVWGHWYDFGGSNIWKKFDDWMILEEHIFGILFSDLMIWRNVELVDIWWLDDFGGKFIWNTFGHWIIWRNMYLEEIWL